MSLPHNFVKTENQKTDLFLYVFELLLKERPAMEVSSLILATELVISKAVQPTPV